MTLFARTATVIEQLEARLASWTLVDTDPTGSKAELDAIATDTSAIASNVRKLETNAKETNPDRRVYNAETAAKVLALVSRFDALLQLLEQQRPRAEAAAAAEATRREEAAQRRAVEEAARRAKEEEEAARQRAVQEADERERCVSRRCTRTSAPSIVSLCSQCVPSPGHAARKKLSVSPLPLQPDSRRKQRLEPQQRRRRRRKQLAKRLRQRRQLQRQQRARPQRSR
jgi:hypothetical protein